VKLLEKDNRPNAWWLLVIFMGIISFPLISLSIASWIEDRYNNYKKWRDSPVPKQVAVKGEKK
jgi:hypothetical protein